MASYNLSDFNQTAYNYGRNLSPKMTDADIYEAVQKMDMVLREKTLDSAVPAFEEQYIYYANNGWPRTASLWKAMMEYLQKDEITDIIDDNASHGKTYGIEADSDNDGVTEVQGETNVAGVNEKNKAPKAADVPTQATGITVKPTSETTNFKPEEYIDKLLGPICANLCFHEENVDKQVPPSTILAVALAVTGFNSGQIGKNNFWGLEFDKELGCDDKADQDNKCAFADATKGVAGILKFIRSEKCNGTLNALSATIENDDKAAKNTTIQNFLKALNHTDASSAALANVEKYHLINWDDPEKKDAKPDAAAESKIAGLMKRVDQMKFKFGVGFDVKRAGEIVTITRLPKGKTTPCEPVYPDLITVSDTVPQWIMTQTVADVNKTAMEEARKAAGLASENADEAAADMWQNEMDQFQKDQFSAWVVKNGIQVDTEEAIQKAKEQYAAGGEGFIDGIYLPDETAKNKYNMLRKRQEQIKEKLGERNSINKAWEAAVAKTGQDIKNRDAQLNQDDKKKDKKDDKKPAGK